LAGVYKLNDRAVASVSDCASALFFSYARGFLRVLSPHALYLHIGFRSSAAVGLRPSRDSDPLTCKSLTDTWDHIYLNSLISDSKVLTLKLEDPQETTYMNAEAWSWMPEERERVRMHRHGGKCRTKAVQSASVVRLVRYYRWCKEPS
jgi:hypothetical protein